MLPLLERRTGKHNVKYVEGVPRMAGRVKGTWCMSGG